MASETSPAVALLPIRPEYASAIMRGDKRVEFRRRGFSRDVEFVVVYASSPVKRILGFFRVSEVAAGHPEELWDRYSEVGAIDLEAYTAYYAGAEQGVAIEIERVCVLQNPVPLSVLGESMKPPQSFQYIDHSDLHRITEASRLMAQASWPMSGELAAAD